MVDQASSPRRLSAIAEQRKIFDIMSGEDVARIEEVFNFSLEKPPAREMGVISSHPVDSPHIPLFQLTNGRVIALRELYQSRTYSGWMVGMPHPYWAFKNALDVVKSHFHWYEGRPIVLEPLRSAGTYAEEDYCADWVTVPLVCSVACFTSHSPVSDQTKSHSDAVVIWFQDRFGFELDARTVSQLQSMDWTSGALDWCD